MFNVERLPKMKPAAFNSKEANVVLRQENYQRCLED